MNTNVTIEQYTHFIAEISQQASIATHRRLVVLSGERRAMVGLALAAVAELNVKTIRWLSDNAPEGELPSGLKVLTAKSAMRQLGSECELIVFDAFAGLHPDGLGAISGTLKAGGLLFLLAPPLNDWASFDDPDYERITSLPYQRASLKRHFLQRIAGIISTSPDVMLVEQVEHNTLRVSQPHLAQPSSRVIDDTLMDGCLTADQQEGVEAVCNVVTGHRRRPLVLTSDRGRGKSSTLGLAAVKLLRQRARRIIITAPYPDAADSAFARLEASFEKGERHGHVFFCEPGSEGTVEFIAPDELITLSPDADLVMVDEAAAIPVSMLTSLLRRYSRIVFASTIHGYEGTGRGFAVRFTKVLNNQTPEWRGMHLNTPIRWAENDPLEQFVFDALLLNAAPSEPDLQAKITPDAVDVRWLDRAELANDSSQLNQVFGLLVLAHYRTSPDDLRMLLDGPSLRIAALYSQSNLLAVALVCREGGLEPELGELIWQGRRRPRGHLIPQALSTFSGDRSATDLVGDRIMRIAVHPELQRSGLGTRLIDAVVESSTKDAMDYVGASFGATEELLSFWAHSELFPVRLGLHKEASSGAHSAIVMTPLSERGQKVYENVRHRFLEQFVFDLSETFSLLDVGLVLQIMATSPGLKLSLDEQDESDLLVFTEHLRIYESCSASVWKLVMIALQKGQLSSQCSELEIVVIVRRVVQKWRPEKLIRNYDLTGKKKLNQTLVEAIRALL